MDYESLRKCVYQRLLWINEEIRKARKSNNTERKNRFVIYRKNTDKLLSSINNSINIAPTDKVLYSQLQEQYRNQELI